MAILIIRILNYAFLDVVKDINMKVFSLTSRINETRQIKWHEIWKCKFILNVKVYCDEQR